MKFFSKLNDVKISWKLPILIVGAGMLGEGAMVLSDAFGVEHSSLFLIGEMLLIATIGVLLARGIAKPLTGLRDAVTLIGRREYDTEVAQTERGDEIGEIARTLETFRGDLAAAEEAARVALFKSSAFEGSSVAMMMIDRDFNITFVNESTKALLTKHEAAFRQIWPSFDAGEIIGTCIDMFHRNPSHQRQLLADPSRLPYRTDITVGDLKFALNVSAVMDENGEYVGNALEWDDVTEERLNAGILSALRQNQLVVEYDLTGAVTNGNDRFFELMGASKPEICGRHHSAFVFEDERKGRDYATL